MPRATVTTDSVRYELNTCPGAYVLLRPMPYGTKLSRTDKAMKMTFKQQTGPKRRGQAQTSDTEVELLQKAATMIDFQTCIVDHDLEDAAGRKLDFNQVADFDQLDPRIGEEIAKLIDELNNFEAPTEDNPEGEEGNSEAR